jgi:hypothetical protein
VIPAELYAPREITEALIKVRLWMRQHRVVSLFGLTDDAKTADALRDLRRQLDEANEKIEAMQKIRELKK